MLSVSSSSGRVFIQNCGGSGQITYNGEPYCEVHESGNSVCMEWDSTTNQVTAAACNGNTLSQHWW